MGDESKLSSMITNATSVKRDKSMHSADYWGEYRRGQENADSKRGSRFRRRGGYRGDFDRYSWGYSDRGRGYRGRDMDVDYEPRRGGFRDRINRGHHMEVDHHQRSGLGKGYRLPSICNNFLQSGECPYGNSCRFLHILKLLCPRIDAHNSGIYSLSMAVNNDTGEIYTTSKDGNVKRWFLKCNGTQAECVPQQSVSFPHPVTTSLYCGNVLILGDVEGNVKVIQTTDGIQTDFKGHVAEITDIQVIDSMLYTADYNGTIRMWKSLPGFTQFECIQAIQTNYPVVCFRGVTWLSAESSPSVSPFDLCLPPLAAPKQMTPTRQLWVGCKGALLIYNREKAELYKEVKFSSSPAHTVMSILQYQNRVVIGRFDGEIMLFSETGEIMKRTLIGKWLCSMDGTMRSHDEAVVVCGLHDGNLHFVKLPDLTDLGITAFGHKKDVRVVRTLQGLNHCFITADIEGGMMFWRWASMNG